MPKSIRPQWIEVARLTIDLMKSSAGVFDDDVFTSSSRDILLFLAVMIGHAQRRPMTALKISEYVGIPRATVSRRLDELCEQKIILRVDGGKCILNLDESNMRQKIARAFDANLSLIHKANSALSKMDK